MIRSAAGQEDALYILGNGSNLLVGDLGYHGVIIQMGDAWNFCRFQGTRAGQEPGSFSPAWQRRHAARAWTGWKRRGNSRNLAGAGDERRRLRI